MGCKCQETPRLASRGSSAPRERTDRERGILPPRTGAGIHQRLPGEGEAEAPAPDPRDA